MHATLTRPAAANARTEAATRDQGEPHRDRGSHVNRYVRDQDSHVTGYGRHNRLLTSQGTGEDARRIYVREDVIPGRDYPELVTEDDLRAAIKRDGWHTGRRGLRYDGPSEPYPAFGGGWESVEHTFTVTTR